MSCVARKPVFGVPNRSDTNQVVQLEKMARSLKFRIKKIDELYFYVSKTKAL